MKNNLVNILSNRLYPEGYERLTISELYNVRGGNSEDKSTSKESDVYDKREI